MPGLINLDFADVRAIMKDAGSALMGIGRASGENRAVEAARQAIASPLLEVDIAGAQGILFNITGSSTLSLYEVTEAAEEIRQAADPEANIIFGTSFNDRLGDEVMITVIATGFDGGKKRQTARADASAGVMDTAASGRPSRERDFLDELQRQRDEASDGGAYPDSLPTSTPVRRRGRGGGRGPARRALGRRAPGRPSARRRRTTRTTSRSRASSAGSDRGRPRAGGPAMNETETRVERYRDARARVLERIAAACARAGRSPDAVTLVAVSKTVAADALRDAVAAGLDLLGENRVQEAAAKAPDVPGRALAAGRAAPVEQGAPGARGVRVDPVGRLGRPRAAARPARPGGPAGRSLPGPAPGERRPRPGQGRVRAGATSTPRWRPSSTCRTCPSRA